MSGKVHDFKMPESQCLNCGHKLDGAFAQQMKKARPAPGDITICIRCGHVMAFADDLTMRALTDAEVIEVAGNEDLLRYQRARGQALTVKAMGYPPNWPRCPNCGKSALDGHITCGSFECDEHGTRRARDLQKRKGGLP
jgi:ribosomal protein L32